jgi:hypothetical protein
MTLRIKKGQFVTLKPLFSRVSEGQEIFCGSHLLPHNNQQWAAADYPLSSDLLGKKPHETVRDLTQY